jgi:hypothetical protein
MGLNHWPGSVFAEDFSFFAGQAVDNHKGRERESPSEGKNQSLTLHGWPLSPASTPSESSREGTIMNWKWALAGAVTTLFLGSWNIGMAGERPVFRAQGGAVYPETYPGHQSGVIYDDCEPCDHGHCCWPFCGIHNCWHYITTLGGRPGAAYGHGHGYGGNQNLYRYRAPKNLVYPAANQPAGVVVYPYYTVKGPDDFFLNH